MKALRREEVALLAGVRVLLDSMEHLPAAVFNSRLDILAVNDLGRALYATMLDIEGPADSARFLFLEEHAARRLFPDWEHIANDAVSILRSEAGRRPDDPALVALIGQLSTRSQAFRTRWAAHNVRAHRAGTEVFRHPLIGEVTLPFENLTIDAAGDQVLTVFTPQPGSPEHDREKRAVSRKRRTRGSTFGVSGPRRLAQRADVARDVHELVDQP